MTTDSAVDARAHARAMIGRALTSEGGHGGLGAAFDMLETRLRRPYARALTEEDRADVRSYVDARVVALYELLERAGAPDTLWSAFADGAGDEGAPAGEDPPA